MIQRVENRSGQLINFFDDEAGTLHGPDGRAICFVRDGRVHNLAGTQWGFFDGRRFANNAGEIIGQTAGPALEAPELEEAAKPSAWLRDRRFGEPDSFAGWREDEVTPEEARRTVEVRRASR